MKMKFFAAAVLAVSTGLAQAEQVSFVFNYTDAAGFGFNDAALGAQRRAAVELAGQYWGSLLQASYAGETINLGMSFNANSTSLNPLSASSLTTTYANAAMDNKGLANVQYVAPLAEHLAGRNLNGTAMDYNLVFNPNVNTYLGLDGNPGANQYDFFSYSLRAIARTLGVVTRFDRSASATQGAYFQQYDPASNSYKMMPGIYDTFLVDGTGKTLTSMTNAQRLAAVTTGDVFWSGANANGQNGGVPLELNVMPLNADGTVNGNALIYMDTNNTNNLLTYLGIQPGETQGLDAQTAGIMKDMGWTLSVPLPVPEASTYAMLLAGLGMIGFMARRRSA
ncbi:PEP-CTERM sorting domain-containing protein [Viridibacterium curvum]|uniref:Ice-binding protein C-terminal domain-containing protein n=1 Tax=Viridibacterium curvum TaxID=1101404 RepID=A0ABP9QVW8_9RHOO